MLGRIIKIVSKEYTILSDDGNRLMAQLSGKIRLQTTPIAGDFVEYESINGVYVIQRIKERKNRLIRPSVANVDQALVLISLKDPDFTSTLIDRLCMLIVHEKIEPILCVTKCDLGIADDIEKQIQEYERGPMRVIRCQKDSLDEGIGDILKGKVSVLTGQSGVGKSSLLNQLNPEFHLAIQAISKALGRGKHTTRHNELHLVSGGLVADTPGFSSVYFGHIAENELAYDVLDFLPYLGKCRFNDCIHENEPDCAIKAAVDRGEISSLRYQNYLAVLELIRLGKGRY
ncbi:MAG: ribosome small subunit-dependent GTPase A [Solobacterium sp.]|nr:ribosome small subunit-dependent GTPase A [Solobacterium sp.]